MIQKNNTGPYRQAATRDQEDVRMIDTNDIKLYFYLKDKPDKLVSTLEFRDNSHVSYYMMGSFFSGGFIDNSSGEDQYINFISKSKEMGGYRTKDMFIPLQSLFKIETDTSFYEKKIYGNKKQV